MFAHEHELGSETLSPFVDSSVDNVLLQTNPDFTNCFLNSSIFLNDVTSRFDVVSKIVLKS